MVKCKNALPLLARFLTSPIGSNKQKAAIPLLARIAASSPPDISIIYDLI